MAVPFRMGFGNFQGPNFGPPPPRMPFNGFRPSGPSFSAPPEPPDIPVALVPALLFVGNIDENCPNDLIKSVLDLFGQVDQWTRMQDPKEGTVKAFGFCSFAEYKSAVFAIRALNNFKIGLKNLTVRADEKAKQLLIDYVVRDRIARKLPRKPQGKDLEPDECDLAGIEEMKQKIKDVICARDGNLIVDENGQTMASKAKRERSSSSDSSRSGNRSPSRQHKDKKSRRKRGRSPGSDKGGKSRRRRSSTASSVRTHSGSDRSDSENERREHKREQRRKDDEYLRQLKKYEEKERRLLKQYAREDEEESSRSKVMQREAKKMGQFLEDYVDERDDPKYYKSSSFLQRKRDYEKEREEDNKDREEEAREIAELKAQISAEKQTPVPAAVETNGVTVKIEKTVEIKKEISVEMSENEEMQFRYSFVEERHNGIKREWSSGSPSTSAPADREAKPSGPKSFAAFQNKVLSAVSGVFGDEDPDEEHVHVIKKKIKPFEITEQDRLEAMTTEERKAMQKRLIDTIPTSKAELFEYTVAWNELDNTLVEERVKPWIEKKIREYIGGEEPSLVKYVCERITGHVAPTTLLSDLSMILDSEAESFVVKLWRLIIFQTQAKKLGINVSSSSRT